MKIKMEATLSDYEAQVLREADQLRAAANEAVDDKVFHAAVAAEKTFLAGKENCKVLDAISRHQDLGFTVLFPDGAVARWPANYNQREGYAVGPLRDPS